MNRSIVQLGRLLPHVRLQVKKKQDWRDGSVLHTLSQVVRSLVAVKATAASTNRAMAEVSAALPPKVRKVLGLTQFSSSFAFKTLRDMPLEGWEDTLSAEALDLLGVAGSKPQVLPGGLLIIDGKNVGGGAGPPPNDLCQTTIDDAGNDYWYVTALRAGLMVGNAVLCAGQHVVPKGQGESTAFKEFLPQLRKRLGEKFPGCVSVDAGLTSWANMQLIRDAQRDYFGQIKRNHRGLYPRMQEAFAGPHPVAAESEDHVSGKHIWRRLYRVAAPQDDPGMPDAQQWWKVEVTIVDRATETTSYAVHFYVSSLPWQAAGPRALLRAIRAHWMIENGSNWTADVIFHEDRHQPCTKGNGVINNSWLWMLAINLVVIARLLLADKRPKTWRWAYQRLRDALMGAELQARRPQRSDQTLA